MRWQSLLAVAVIVTPKQKKKRLVWFAGALVLLLTGGAIFLVLHQRNKPLDAEHLLIHTADLRSCAAESALLAQEASIGQLSDNFFAVHAGLLRDKTRQTEQALEDATPRPRLEKALRHAIVLSKKVAEASAIAIRSFDDPKALSHATLELKDAIAQLLQLEEALSQS